MYFFILKNRSGDIWVNEFSKMVTNSYHLILREDWVTLTTIIRKKCTVVSCRKKTLSTGVNSCYRNSRMFLVPFKFHTVALLDPYSVAEFGTLILRHPSHQSSIIFVFLFRTWLREYSCLSTNGSFVALLMNALPVFEDWSLSFAVGMAILLGNVWRPMGPTFVFQVCRKYRQLENEVN